MSLYKGTTENVVPVVRVNSNGDVFIKESNTPRLWKQGEWVGDTPDHETNADGIRQASSDSFCTDAIIY